MALDSTIDLMNVYDGDEDLRSSSSMTSFGQASEAREAREAQKEAPLKKQTVGSQPTRNRPLVIVTPSNSFK